MGLCLPWAWSGLPDWKVAAGLMDAILMYTGFRQITMIPVTDATTSSQTEFDWKMIDKDIKKKRMITLVPRIHRHSYIIRVFKQSEQPDFWRIFNG